MPKTPKFLILLALLACVISAPAQSITNPIAQLKNHILAVTNLTAAQIATQGNSIQASIRQVGTNSVALAAALDLVATYDTTIGAIFTTTATKNGFTRDGSGFELAQALFDLQQGIMDFTYTPANLTTYYSQLNNTKFATATYFPGAVAQPATTNQGYAALINATQGATWGSPVEFETYAARRPTGCYLAPGSIAYVTVPAALVNKGYNVRVGAHSWDLSAKTTLKRLDRVSLVYPITSTTTRIGNPLGGGIYIEVPYMITNGIVTVGITNVVRSPFFSATFFHQTTAAEWLTERTNVGKWADFESDKFMMQVPRSWIYNYTNAVNVMQDWDSAMDAVSDLFGYPRVRNKTVLYIQTDVLYRGTANEPGYPQSNDPYNPNTVESGNKNHYFLTGPQNSPWTTLHEVGHSQSFTKFTGEMESAVNLLDATVLNEKFGMDLDAALGESIGDAANANITRKQAALSWILPDKFRAGLPMADTDMKYQHRGHAKYVEIAGLFGWGALSNFWYSVNVDYMHGISYPVNSDPTDSRILRMSKAAGVDLRPLLHFWGVQPVSPNTLKTSMANAGLRPSLAIYNRLKYYQSVVPTNLTQFRANYNAVHGHISEPDNSWYTNMYYNFTSDIGSNSIKVVQSIIDLYFPDGAPLGIRWTGAASGLWNTSAINWKNINTGAATSYTDGISGDSVLFDDTLMANPAVTLNVTIGPSGVMFSNNATAYSLAGTGRMAGSGALTKAGAATLTLSGNHTFSGGINIIAGELVGATGGSCSNSAISVSSGATNGVQILTTNGQWWCGGLTSSSSSYLDFNFGSQIPSTANAPLQVTGNLALNGAKIIVRSSATLPVGQYPLIKYMGALSDVVPNTAFSLPPLSPGTRGTILNNSGNQSIDLIVAVGTPLTWAVANGNWDINVSPNWQSNGIPGFVYTDGKEVIFDDTASGASPILVTNTVTVSPSLISFNLTNKDYTMSGSPIAGSAALTKGGSGTLMVSNNNSFTGSTTVNAGTLRLGVANAFGAGVVTVQDGATLDLNSFGLTGKSYCIHIAGTGVGDAGALVNKKATLNLALTNLVLDADASVGGGYRFDMRPVTAAPSVDLAGHTLTKVGLNQFWLQQCSSITGGNIVVQEGILGLNGMVVTGSGQLTVMNGAELRFFRSTDPTTVTTIERPIILEDGAILSYTGNETTNAIDQSVASPIMLAGDATIQVGGGTGSSAGAVFELAGPISGPYGFTKTSTNILMISGANTYTGDTIVTTGTLRLGAADVIPDGSGGGDNNEAPAGNVSVSAAGILDLNTFSETINGLSGAGSVDTVAGGTPTLTIGANDQTSAFSGIIQNTAGTLAVAKTGAGTLTLSGANTYGGGTIVSQGTLLVNNTTGSGTGTDSVTVNNGATLGGTGIMVGDILIQAGGTLAPGASLGRLTIDGNLTLQGAAAMEIARNGSALTNDLVAGVRTNTYGGTLIVMNIGSSSLQPGDSFKLFAATNYAGAFASIVYPAGYTFTNTLGVDGRIWVASVIPATPPGFSLGGIVQLSNGNFSLTATGAMGAPYRLWANADMAIASASNSWTLITNGVINTNPFTLTDPTATNFPQRFYRFSAP